MLVTRNGITRKFKRPVKYSQTGNSARKKPAGYLERKKLQYVINAHKYAGAFLEDRWIDFAIQYFTPAELRRLCGDLLKSAQKIKLDVVQELASFKGGESTPGEIINALYRNVFMKNRIFRALLQRMENFATGHKGKEEFASDKLCRIAELFDLNKSECAVMEFLYLQHIDSAVDRLYDDLCDKTGVRSSAYSGTNASRKRPISIITGLRASETALALSDSSNLLRCGILDSDRDLAGEVVLYLEGSSTKPIGENYFSQFAGNAVPLSSHVIEKEHIETVQAILAHRTKDHPVNILLYGVPGTGKTEFARSLGRHLGLKMYEVAGISDPGSGEKGANTSSSFRYRAFLACQRSIDTARSMIIVDEADTVLNTVAEFFFASPSSDKGQVNRLLDDSKAFTVWITNKFNCIDNSTRRRFDYSIGFEPLTFEQRRSIWRHSVRKHHVTRCFKEEEIERLASNYETSAGGIDIALRNASRIFKKNPDSGEVIGLVESLMKAHLTILDMDIYKAQQKAPNGPAYDIDAINVKGGIQNTFKVLDSFNRYWKSGGETDIKNMNVLMYGPPGTGKTEFAKYLARKFCRRLIVKRASDLLDMYVGNTEKFIKNAFREAEKDKAILFIDEADSFLSSRESAIRSWEITSVNELLTNMETFRGMLLCSTNFRKIIDSAAIRRFNVKMEFDYLEPAGILKLYDIFMSPVIKTSLSREESAELAAMRNLTAGDFKVVYQRHYFMDKNSVTHRMLLNSLAGEVRAKGGSVGKTMGFSK